jgi:hypothetical protein
MSPERESGTPATVSVGVESMAASCLVMILAGLVLPKALLVSFDRALLPWK